MGNNYEWVCEFSDTDCWGVGEKFKTRKDVIEFSKKEALAMGLDRFFIAQAIPVSVVPDLAEQAIDIAIDSLWDMIGEACESWDPSMEDEIVLEEMLGETWKKWLRERHLDMMGYHIINVEKINVADVGGE